MRNANWVFHPLFFIVLCAATGTTLTSAGLAQEGQPSTKPAPVPPPPTPPPAPAPAPTTAPAPPPVSAPSTQPVEEDLITSPTGLKYKDLNVGDGAQPQKGDKLTVKYKGTLEDGSVFDSSDERGKPLDFRLGINRLIAGWDEGMTTMKAGGKRVLVIPPQLGFGLQGRPPKIPANATLRFEVELVAVDPAPRITETRKEDEVAMPSGLRYVEIKPGEGEAVKEDSTLKLRASRWTSAGVLLDSNADQPEPTPIPLSRPNIAGMRDGLLGMKAGGKRKLLVPPRRPPSTQPASAPAEEDFTIVEVELVEVFTPPPPPEQTPVKDDQYITTPSGLKYYDLKVGEGDSPKETSTVKVHYTGWLTDGKVFDSSVTRGQPYELPLNKFVKGWIEGVGSMKVGGKRKLIVPPELAYGAQGRPSIPPNSTLIFEVELLEITQP